MSLSDHEKLIRLYELILNEEYKFLDSHQSRIRFYAGVVTALIAATVAGVFKASEWYHFAILLVGPILIFALSSFAIDGTFRFYQRFLESITMRAKIEQEMGLTSE